MREVRAEETKRAAAFALWKDAPMPMITIIKTLDVTNLVRVSRRKGYPFTMLLCWCIGRTAARREEFYLLPVGGKLMQFDKLAVNTVVATRDGDISTCDIPFLERLEEFAQAYQRLTRQVRDSGEAYDLGEDYMVIGTSALPRHEIDGAVNIYAGIYNNPFFIWGHYRKKFLNMKLPISFQFHHTQLDGVPAAQFLDDLQREISGLKG